MTLERIRLCKRDGVHLADPLHVSERDDAGLPVWQRIVVHSEQQAKAGGRPLYMELVRRLRAAGAAGATVLRSTAGYYGDRRPSRDRLVALTRNVPVHCIVVDTPERMRRWWPVIDDVTRESGLVTSEPVPASHARSGEARRGRFATAIIQRLMHEEETPPF